MFTPDLLVSSSELEIEEAMRVGKVLWREVDATSEEQGVGEKLGRIKCIPKSGRVFSGREVGLLERFRVRDLEGFTEG